MKKILIGIILLLVLGGAVFLIYRHNKSKNTDTPQYGILNPNGNGQNGGVPAPGEQKPEESKPEAPRGQVLGETRPAPKPEPAAPAQRPATPAPTDSLATYTITELSFQISVPQTWQPRLETAAGNVVAFYVAEGQVGQIEVIPNAQQSFESLTAEVSANPNVSNIQQTRVNGQSALIFNDSRFGNGKAIAFVYKGNVYYLRGANAQEPEISRLKLL